MNIPNLISLLRLLMVPLIVYLLVEHEFHAVFWLFVAAGVSDAVDGFLAKRLDQVSTIGAYLDPLADKALLVAVYLALGSLGHLPISLVILVVSRDILIVGGALLLLIVTGSLGIKPLYVSKLNTAAQIGLVAVVLAMLGLELDLEPARIWLVYMVAASTILSGAGYLVTWARQIARAEEPMNR